MEKEKVLEIKIKKINDEYSVFYFNNKNDFTILLNDTSLNVPFIIENIYIEELKKIVDEYNKKYEKKQKK